MEKEEMDNPVRDIGIIVVALLVCAWWWFIAKEAASRKYIVLLGVCWLVAGITYNIGKWFDIPVMGFIVLPALVGSFYFFIRAALSERKFKKSLKD